MKPLCDQFLSLAKALGALDVDADGRASISEDNVRAIFAFMDLMPLPAEPVPPPPARRKWWPW